MSTGRSSPGTQLASTAERDPEAPQQPGVRAQLSTAEKLSQNCLPSLSRCPLRKAFHISLSWVLWSDCSDHGRQRACDVRERSHKRPGWLLFLLLKVILCTASFPPAAPPFPLHLHLPSASPPPSCVSIVFTSISHGFPHVACNCTAPSVPGISFLPLFIALSSGGLEKTSSPTHSTMCPLDRSAPFVLNFSTWSASPASGPPQRTHPPCYLMHSGP